MERDISLALLTMRGFLVKWFGLVGCMTLAGCMGSSGDNVLTPRQIVDNLPDDIVPVVIETDEVIRDRIDRDVPGDIGVRADDIIDLVVAITTTSVSVTGISVTGGTR